jgi:hypothetical protein
MAPLPTTIYDTPQSALYLPDGDGRRQLQAALDDMYRNTRVSPPSSIRDVRLDHRTRRTQSGARYISSALFRVCRVLAPGLSTTVVSLSGAERTGDRLREHFSTTTACAIFNDIVDLRFSGVLSQSQFVIDEHRQTVEGLLGPKTHYFENGSFVELVESVLRDTCDATFAGATLVGRRLFVRYLRPEPIHTVVGTYRRGYAFCATEAGDDAIRGYLLYQRDECGSCCLEAPTGGLMRQRRTGSKFIENIKRLLARLLSDSQREWPQEVEGLMQRPIFRSTDGRAIARVLASWRRRFKLAGMPADIAAGVTARMMGQDQTQTMEPVLTLAEINSKTEYDMFLIAMDESRRRGQRLRELSERATFNVFFGDA